MLSAEGIISLFSSKHGHTHTNITTVTAAAAFFAILAPIKRRPDTWKSSVVFVIQTVYHAERNVKLSPHSACVCVLVRA